MSGWKAPFLVWLALSALLLWLGQRYADKILGWLLTGDGWRWL